jgi:monofunctional glycosyltransferase
MEIRPRTRSFPTPRGVVIQIHKDLFTIDKRVRWYVDYEPLTPVEKLILILEDRRFFRHNGIDCRSCIRELIKAATLQPHGGASTIDMQLVRTATNYRKRTIRRKLYEFFLAWLIQYRYNKITILRSYTNCAFFGSHAFGLNRICRIEFNKTPNDLTFDEAAMVAAMLVYPRPLRPTPEWRAKVRRRADYGSRLYPRLEQSFDKLPKWELI